MRPAQQTACTSVFLRARVATLSACHCGGIKKGTLLYKLGGPPTRRGENSDLPCVGLAGVLQIRGRGRLREEGVRLLRHRHKRLPFGGICGDGLTKRGGESTLFEAAGAASPISAARALRYLAARGVGSMYLVKYLTPWKSITLIQFASKRGRAGRSTEVGIVACPHGGRASRRRYS